MSGPLSGRPTLPILGLLLQVADVLSPRPVPILRNGDGGARGAGSAARSEAQRHRSGHGDFFDICRGLPEGAEIAISVGRRSRWAFRPQPLPTIRPCPPPIFQESWMSWQSKVGIYPPQEATSRQSDRSHPVLDGAPGCSLLLKRHAVWETEGSERCARWPPMVTAWRCSMPLEASLPSPFDKYA